MELLERRNGVLICGLHFLLRLSAATAQGEYNSRCYDEAGRAQKCVPEFVNAAFNVLVEATNTCGDPPSEYCFQSGITGATKSCEICDARDPVRSHPASFLTDFNNNDNTTWWQSETMMDRAIQYPGTVNLTLSLGKSFDITYIRLKFQTSRPESFAIFKRTSDGGAWTPYQYYSGSCKETYNLADNGYVRRGDEARALCTAEFSDISPLVGGNVAFSTLDGRPTSVDDSPPLQEWVTATSILIVFQRMNTFGDELFGDHNVLRSYYYAVNDFAVGARCKCNGHASECVRSTGQGLDDRLVCRCEHNTAGVDCQECQPFYQDRPWSRATTENAHECQACNCSGLSQRCYFDKQLFETSGHGGHCMDCEGNTDGPHCEKCKDNHYRRGNTCLACNCNQIGAYKTQCNGTGTCECKPGVAGDKCDRCEVNFYDFTVRGCRPCGCTVAGSMNNIPNCTPNTGQCSCKEHVEGQNCDKCKPGFFNLEEKNPFGCVSCFCFGHSSICQSSTEYTRTSLATDFTKGVGGWTAVTLNHRNVTLEILPVGPSGLGIRQVGGDPVYFVAPDTYLGDRRFSYDETLSFSLRLAQDGARASIHDIVLEGAGQDNDIIKVSIPIFAQGNPLPNRERKDYKFRLHEHPDYQWSPRLSSFEFQRLLSNVTSLRIRVTYIHDGTGYLDNLSIGSAAQIGLSPTTSIGQLAAHVETCQCPTGYVGQFCEDCASGYRRAIPNGNSLALCVPCTCNNHSETCERKTGKCICQHNTAGDNCEKCASGFYGRATAGTPDDCKACPCPNNGPCTQLRNGDVVCVGCAPGYAGLRCDVCADGYFGDPEGKNGPKTPCQPCRCNNNIDPNAVGNCDSLTGTCLKCIHNTTGSSCENCLQGFYGDALKKTCQPCQCYPPGTEAVSGTVLDCDKSTGQCPCKPYVTGRRCDDAPIGFWNIAMGDGGQRCDCDPKGSFNRTCDLQTGQCFCRDGVIGRKCDQCLPNHYGFSATGCRACNCDTLGATSMQCDPNTGQCPCQNGVVGKQCNRCQENRYNIAAGCLQCSPCYNLVQEQADSYRGKLRKLEQALDDVATASVTMDDPEGFKRRVALLNGQIDELQSMANNAIGSAGISQVESANLVGRLEQINKRIAGIQQKLHNTSSLIESGRMFSNDAGFVVTEAERLVQRCFEMLTGTQNYLEGEAREAFLAAEEASTRFGQTSYRMSEIARDSRRLADEHEAASAAIIDLADQALNASREALRILTDRVAQRNNNSQILSQLRNDQIQLQQLQTRVSNLAEMAKSDADKAYSEALEIYAQATNLVVPKIDVPMLMSQAMTIDNRSNEIATSSNNLLTGNQDMLASINEQQAEARRLLMVGKGLQQDTDEMLASIDKAKADADDAIRKAEGILKEARDTLETLQSFNAVARRSEAAAKESIRDIPRINQALDAALQKNQEARNDLYEAETDAKRAKTVALQAQKTAEEASKVAGKIKDDSNSAKVFAGSLKQRADELASDVNTANTAFDDFVSQARVDETAVKDAIDKSGEAKRKAEQARQKVDQAVEMVDNILSELGGLEEIDGGRLDALEAQLAEAERQLAAANLDARLRTLTQNRQTQQRIINDYTLELDKLRREVTTIEAIKNSLPEQCFNLIRLEP